MIQSILIMIGMIIAILILGLFFWLGWKGTPKVKGGKRMGLSAILIIMAILGGWMVFEKEFFWGSFLLIICLWKLYELWVKNN